MYNAVVKSSITFCLLIYCFDVRHVYTGRWLFHANTTFCTKVADGDPTVRQGCYVSCLLVFKGTWIKTCHNGTLANLVDRDAIKWFINISSTNHFRTIFVFSRGNDQPLYVGDIISIYFCRFWSGSFICVTRSYGIPLGPSQLYFLSLHDTKERQNERAIRKKDRARQRTTERGKRTTERRYDGARRRYESTTERGDGATGRRSEAKERKSEAKQRRSEAKQRQSDGRTERGEGTKVRRNEATERRNDGARRRSERATERRSGAKERRSDETRQKNERARRKNDGTRQSSDRATFIFICTVAPALNSSKGLLSAVYAITNQISRRNVQNAC